MALENLEALKSKGKAVSSTLDKLIASEEEKKIINVLWSNLNGFIHYANFYRSPEYYNWHKLHLVIALQPMGVNLCISFEENIEVLLMWWKEEIVMMWLLL